MKSLLTCSLLILAVTMVLVGIPDSVYAQKDLDILVKIANRAQDQISTQISQESPDKLKELFEEGSKNVSALEESVQNNDSSSAKENFLSAMKVFSEISREITKENSISKTDTNSSTTPIQNPMNVLQRLEVYVNNLKIISEKQKVQSDFSQLDLLFDKAYQQISKNQFFQASETITKIKAGIVEIAREHQQERTKQESERAKQYALRYLEKLDRLIDNAKKQDIPIEIIERLENTKIRLSLTENPKEILKEIRNVMLIKNEFNLTENDQIESKIFQVEKTLIKLSNIDNVNSAELDDAKKTLQNIKQYLNEGDYNSVNEILKDLENQLAEIKNSL